MNIENFCCAAAELQNKMTQTTKMSQIYYYRAFGEETREDFLADNFFNQAQERVKVNDIIIGYYPDDEDNTLICWLKVTSNFGGKVTVEPFIADATLKEYVDSITPPLEDIFYATYGETTYSEITNALDDGKTVFCEYTTGQDFYEAVFVASQNGLYQFTHSIANLDGGKITGNIQTFSVDTNDDWTTDSIYLQEKLVSGTNIKTVNGNSLVGSGNVDIDALPSQTGQAGKYLTTDGTNPSWNAISVEADDISINRNSDDELQTIGVINQNDTTTAIKTWTGTKAQYEAIVTKNANTEYFCTDSGELYLGDVKIGSGSGLEIGDIGIAPLGIDETENKRRYLNGQVISQAQFVSFTNKLKSIVALYPNLSTTEVNWQAEVTNSALGQCGKFVIDDVAGTIRLPKVVNINGLQNLAILGGIKAESLPNITGKGIGSADLGVSGAFYDYEINGGLAGGSAANKIGFDASRSSSTYQDNAPVQQEAVQYPYFIQVATGVKTSIDVSEQIKLNLPFSLLDYKYSEYELDNASWLRADTFSWASGAVYVSAYEHLVDDIDGITAETETIAGYTVTFYRATDGHKICLADQESTVADIFTATGVAWYYILDTANQRFKLPRELPFDGQAKGNGITLGLTNGTTNGGLSYIPNAYMGTFTDTYGTNVQTTTPTTTAVLGRVGITTDPTKSGIILNRDNTDSQKYLYFYVGETVQDANLINAGAVLDALDDKVDIDLNNCTKPYITETYVNGSSWYRVYSDGWCEQGGLQLGNGTGNFCTITLLKEMADTNYTITALTKFKFAWCCEATDGVKSTTQFSIYTVDNAGQGWSRDFYWQVCGYIS